VIRLKVEFLIDCYPANRRKASRLVLAEEMRIDHDQRRQTANDMVEQFRVYRYEFHIALSTGYAAYGTAGKFMSTLAVEFSSQRGGQLPQSLQRM
jgi:hypothetical protein